MRRTPKQPASTPWRAERDHGSNCRWDRKEFAHRTGRGMTTDSLRKSEQLRTVQPLDALEVDPSKTGPYTARKLLESRTELEPLNRNNRDEEEKRSRINWGRGTEPGHHKKQATILITDTKTTEDRALWDLKSYPDPNYLLSIQEY